MRTNEELEAGLRIWKERMTDANERNDLQSLAYSLGVIHAIEWCAGVSPSEIIKELDLLGE
jgi:hypothetical protein